MIRCKDFINGRDIQKQIQRRLSKCAIFIIIVGIVSLIVAFCLEYFYCFRVFMTSFIKNILISNLPWFYEELSLTKMNWKTGMGELCGFVVTSHTVLAASVIFFYSVMDNRKEGIPHRTIMAYSFGSLTIPILFIESALGVIVAFFSLRMSWFYLTMTAVIDILVIQFICIGLILLSTSYHYVIHAICNVEIRQFEYISKIKDSRKEQMAWIYLMRHMEQAIKSNELMGDKMVLLQKLLYVPFYEKERRFGKFYIYSKKLHTIDDPSKVYSYYYNNLLPIFFYLKSSENSEERIKIYQIIYELILCVDSSYQEQTADTEKEVNRSYNNLLNLCQLNYLATTSAIINAVLYSNVKESEVVCNSVLSRCIRTKTIKQLQINLYFLYQELLYRINKKAIKLKDINGIAENLQIKVNDEDMKIYSTIWEYWCKDISLSQYRKYLYLDNALSTLKGETTLSEPINYIISMINQQREIIQ